MRTAPRLAALTLPALFLAPLTTACATGESPPPTRIETQPAVVGSPPVREAAPRALEGEARPTPERRVNTAFIYDRVLAKLEDPEAMDLEALERAVEERTGAEVKEIRTGPMGLLSIIFEEASPPRGEEEQRALVERLQGMPELRYAEPERLLQAH